MVETSFRSFQRRHRTGWCWVGGSHFASTFCPDTFHLLFSLVPRWSPVLGTCCGVSGQARAACPCCSGRVDVGLGWWSHGGKGGDPST